MRNAMTNRLITMTALSSVLVLATVACGKESPPTRTANDVQGVTMTSAATPGSAPNENGVTMSADLRHVCGIEDTGAAPKFEFDSSVLSTTDRSELDQLATCMTTGPLAGKNVELVGRADPRGEAEYNMNLGATRASAVKVYLDKLGIAAARLDTTSRGSLDATGHDEATWAVDRRVDLRLAGQ
jgi:peptidoglycan-associated lipoprotein